MSKNLTLEIPEPEAARFEALLDELNETLRRIEDESPRRHAEMEQLTKDGRAVMRDVWARIGNVEETR